MLGFKLSLGESQHAELKRPDLANLHACISTKRRRHSLSRAFQARPLCTLQSRGNIDFTQSSNASIIASSGHEQPFTAPAPSSGQNSTLPNHIAVIMDGNSRWARKRGLPAFSGHQNGVDAMRRTVQACCQRGIKCLTVFALSKENWQRDRKEVEYLLKLIESVLDRELQNLISAGVRMTFIGDKTSLPPSLVQQLDKAELATSTNSTLHLTVALSYSGQDDITAAVQKICERVAVGEITPDQVNSDMIASNLSSSHLPWTAPDLVIRTSGEQRLSNFLLWESAYAEMYFTDVLWPDFGDKELDAALKEYSRRERRFGRH